MVAAALAALAGQIHASCTRRPSRTHSPCTTPDPLCIVCTNSGSEDRRVAVALCGRQAAAMRARGRRAARRERACDERACGERACGRRMMVVDCDACESLLNRREHLLSFFSSVMDEAHATMLPASSVARAKTSSGAFSSSDYRFRVVPAIRCCYPLRSVAARRPFYTRYFTATTQIHGACCNSYRQLVRLSEWVLRALDRVRVRPRHSGRVALELAHHPINQLNVVVVKHRAREELRLDALFLRAMKDAPIVRLVEIRIFHGADDDGA